MRSRILVVFGATLLASCGGQMQLRSLEMSNALRVDPAPPGTGADYVVSIRNLKDIGYDPDDQVDRNDIALRAVASQCPSGRVVGETVIDTGTYLLGNPARTYAIRVACR